MPQKLRHKKMKLKWVDIREQMRGDLAAVVWRYKTDIQMLIDIHRPLAEVNFCDEKGNFIKPHTLWMNITIYSTTNHTRKLMKKLFFHLLELPILNSYILLSS
jgi:hypothetical protein